MTDLFDRIAKLKVLVVGDVILDIYRVAQAIRISPEAPVPVLLNPTVEYRPGGAASVAAMCSALGAEVVLIGVTGDDRDGQRLTHLLEVLGVGSMLVGDNTRTTTVKERICGVASGRHRQQLARIDRESTAPISADLSQRLTDIVTGIQKDIDLILVADYAKGVMTDQLAMACVDAGPCIVDPPKGRLWSQYRCASCMVPNREEANGSSPLDLVTEYSLEAAVVKLDQDGCRLQDDQIPMIRSIPARARQVHDVTGAGDQFMSVLGLARAAGDSWFQAATIATTAAGLQVERHGCTPITPDELRQEST